MKATILGCGSSTGVPVIGCGCGVCTSNKPKNKRGRVSVLVETHGKSILIDSSPDIREQMLRERVKTLDAVLYTHEHADHTQGLDDLRSFNHLSNKALPIYCNEKTLKELQTRFAYAFLPKPNVWFRPCLEPRLLADNDVASFDVSGIPVTCFKQLHGKITTLGFRIGNFAYSTDVNGLQDYAYKALEGVDLWVVDCLRYSDSMGHASLVMALEWIAHVQPKRAVLTHMGHEIDYDTLKSELPDGVEPAYDGMYFELAEP